MASERLPALSAVNGLGVSPAAAPSGLLEARITSPASGDSTLITSAPSCAR